MGGVIDIYFIAALYYPVNTFTTSLKSSRLCVEDQPVESSIYENRLSFFFLFFGQKIDHPT